MAIIHNLATITDNLSGYDPVAGQVDGTTMGKSWIMWKMWEGMAAFNTNFKLITNASPTPTFLQGATSGLVAEPAVSRSTANDVIRFYDTTDVGLSQATPCAFIHELWMSSSRLDYGFTKRLYHLVSGGSVIDAGITSTNWVNSQNSATNLKIYMCTGAGSTTTLVDDIPKLVFWKSSNAFMMLGIHKADNTYRGGMIMFNPTYTVYRDGIGLCTQGVNSNVSVAIGGISSANSGFFCYEAFTNLLQVIQVGLTTNIEGISVLISSGSVGSTLFNWSSANHLLSGKMRLASFSDQASKVYKLISDEIEGVKLVNPAQAGLGTYGAIQLLDGKYYIHYANIHADKSWNRMIFELGT